MLPVPLPTIVSPPDAVLPTQKQVTKPRKPAGPKHKLQRAQLPHDLDIRGTEVCFNYQISTIQL